MLGPPLEFPALIGARLIRPAGAFSTTGWRDITAGGAATVKECLLGIRRP